VNDRGQAPDGHDHVGNGSLTRQAGANGSEPGLEELVESWRRRANGVPQEDEAEPHIARGRAEVPGGAFHADPADVTPVTPVPVTPNPPIPQQPGPADPPPAAPSASTHHFPSAYPQVPAEERPMYPPSRRAERAHYDERIRYQRPFRFRQRQDDRHGSTGRAEAQFGPAEFGPPEYSPPNYGPIDHRPTGPRAPEFGGPPHSPAPWGAGSAPSPYGVQPPFGAGEVEPYPGSQPGTNGTGPAATGFGWTPAEGAPPPPPAAQPAPADPAAAPPTAAFPSTSFPSTSFPSASFPSTSFPSAAASFPPPAGSLAPSAAPPTGSHTLPLEQQAPEPPAVPAPLIPPSPPTADARWSAGPWADSAWSAGASPAVEWAGAAHSAPGQQDGPPAPPAPPIPSAQPAPPLRASQLPQRIPAEPDVPAVPGDDGPEGSEDLSDIARIIDYFRDEERDEEQVDERRDGFDFPAVIEAVRGVVGVRDAELVTVNDTHTLRLDLADDADPGDVSRAVARLLKEQMGVSAEPSQQAPAEPEEEQIAEPVEAVTEVAAEVAAQVEVAAPVEAEVAAQVEAVEATADEFADESAELFELPELVPAAPPLPARLAGLPRIGEAPAPADGVRVATVPRDDARSGRPVRRSLESRITALEPALSFDDWLETVRPDRPRPVMRAPVMEPVIEPVIEPAAEPAVEDTATVETTAEPAVAAVAAVDEPVAVAQPDEHRSLVGMPTVPVFNDPLEPAPAAEPAPEPEAEPVAEAPHEVDAADEPPGPLVLAPGAPAVQVAGTGGRVRLDQVEVTNQGLDAVVEVRLSAGDEHAVGSAAGPAVDQYLLRMCATATASALDTLLTDTETGVAGGRCYVEHAAVVSLGTCEVAVVVLLLTSGGWVEQLTGSALVAGDARQAIVRATLAAANRRLDSLLP